MADPAAGNAVVGEPEVKGEAGPVGKSVNTLEQTPIADNKGEKHNVEEATNCEREGKLGDNIEGVTSDNSNTFVESEEPSVIQIQEEMANVSIKPQGSPSVKRADVKSKSEQVTSKGQSKKIEVNKRDIVTVKKVETRGKNEARPSSGNRSGKTTPQKQSPQKGKADSKGGQMLLSSRGSQQYSRNPKNPWNKPASPEGLPFYVYLLFYVFYVLVIKPRVTCTTCSILVVVHFISSSGQQEGNH